MGRFRSALKAGALVFMLFPAYNQAVAADELQDISALHSKGESPQALFLKGQILAAQGKTPEAIAIYVSLTENYPELPEPYNNLAVLYAAQNRLNQARQALEMAISAHPGYATAHENLGDIYVQMARQAYEKTLQLDKGNTSARGKLARAQEIIPSANPSTNKSAPATTNNKAGI